VSIEICFDGYLRSIINTHQKWQEWYTPTDTTERDRPAFFDFGLMVQTVEPTKADRQRESDLDREKNEKIERLPVLEGIYKYAAEHVLLVGRPGSGKSTALARLLLQEAEKALSDRQAKIPVLVELRYLSSEANGSSVCDRIVAFMHKHDPALGIDEAGIKQLLSQGRLLLLVDGVNELPSDRLGRPQVIQFRELYQKNCPMIFTTRELNASVDFGIAKRLEMQPLTEPQMQQFVMAYLPKQGENLLRQLSGRLREFGQTPLLLWMLCSLFQHPEFKGQIPPNLGMVFRAFTVGYGDRIKQDVTLSKDSRAWWGRLLQYLAFKMTCGENLTELRVAISRRDAEQFLRGKVEFADDCAVRWLEDLLKHHLIQISNDRIEFRHQLIQEYYAAEWLLGLLPSLSDARLRQVYLNYLKWTEPLALMLELVDSEEQAVRVVRLALGMNLKLGFRLRMMSFLNRLQLALDVDLRLGARLAGAVKYEFQEKTVGLLIQEINRRRIPEEYAIELFEETKSNFAFAPLILALYDSSIHVSHYASEALGKIDSDRAVDHLILFLNDSEEYVRMFGVEALSKIGSEKAVDALILALYDSSIYVSHNAAEALGKIGSEKAVDALILALYGSSAYVSLTAADALGKIGSEKAVDALILALKDSDDKVRESAAKALGEIGSDRAVDALILALKDSDDKVRESAAKALGEIGSDRAVDALILALKDSDDKARESAVKALGNIGSGRVIDPLILALYDSSIHVSHYAAEALGKIRSEKAVDALILALKDSYVRSKAARVLGEIGSDRAVDNLILSLNDSDYFVRSDAAKALGKIGSKKAVDNLILSLNDSYSYVREFASEALGEIGSEGAVDALILALKNPYDNVREQAACALGKISSEKAVDALILALADSNYFVSTEVARALGKIGNEKAVDPLIAAFKGSFKCTRGMAALALGDIGSEKAVDALILALKNPYDNVRQQAACALGKIGSKKAVDCLILALKDSDDIVRGQVSWALGLLAEDDIAVSNECGTGISFNKVANDIFLIEGIDKS